MKGKVFIKPQKIGVLMVILLIASLKSNSSIADDVASELNNDLSEVTPTNQVTDVYIPPLDGLVLDKTAKVYQTAEDGRQTFQLDLWAKATSNIVITKKPADIVLVFDNSSSLSGNTDDKPKIPRQAAAVTAAAIFVNNLSVYAPESTVAVVHTKETGKTDETTVTGFMPVATEHNSIIENISLMTTNGSNVVDRGLAAAYNLYSSLTYTPERMRIVIVVTGATAGGPIMADMIQWSALLKGSPASIINPSTLTIGNQNGTGVVPTNVAGCGAQIYTIGVFADANAITNEYLWRVSSNTKTSLPVTGEDYAPNVPGGFYITTNYASELNAIFAGIAEQMGLSLDNVVARDYIDPRFEVVDLLGNIVSVGTSFVAPDGQIVTLNSDFIGNLYVEWPECKIAPESYEGAGDQQTFAGNLLVRPKFGFIGGNNIPTNISNSTALYAENYNIGSFPNPLVNVPFKLNITDISDTIFLGESILRNEETALLDILGNALNFNYPAEMVQYGWGEDGYFNQNFEPIDNIYDSLIVCVIPKDVVDFTDISMGWVFLLDEMDQMIAYQKATGEIYYPAVGTAATSITEVGTYNVYVVKGTLQITKQIEDIDNYHDPNQTFVFEIKQFQDMSKTVLIKTFYETIRVTSNTSEQSATINNLSKGYYEITEKSDWSWQYNLVSNGTIYDFLGMNQDGSRNLEKIYGAASFMNETREQTWLTSIDWLLNSFRSSNTQ